MLCGRGAHPSSGRFWKDLGAPSREACGSGGAPGRLGGNDLPLSPAREIFTRRGGVLRGRHRRPAALLCCSSSRRPCRPSARKCRRRPPRRSTRRRCSPRSRTSRVNRPASSARNARGSRRPSTPPSTIPRGRIEQAVTAVEIQGGGNEGSRLVDWRRRNAPLLHDRNFLEAVRLQLTYLGLAWQHSSGVKPKDQLPALLDYTAQVNNAGDAITTFDVLKKPLSGSVFTAYFQLGPFLSQGGDWEDRPFNVDGIYQKTILPAMRARPATRACSPTGTDASSRRRPARNSRKTAWRPTGRPTSCCRNCPGAAPRTNLPSA